MKIIACNLKMNLLKSDIEEYNKVISNMSYPVIVAPSNIYLNMFNLDNICSQDGYYEDKGAFTGEVSFSQLKSIGVKYSLIGHSERRHIFNENNDLIHNKFVSCINNEIIPILCVGETKEEKNNNKAFDIVKEQIDSAIKDTNISSIIIAYEPVWSIGTGLIPTLEDIEKMHTFIKSILNIECKVLYGGSVNINNSHQILNTNNVDGVLIGGASLNPNNIIEIVNNI